MKFLLRLVVVVLLIAVVGVVALVFYLDTIAKNAIERGGTFALGVPVEVGRVDIGVLGGTFDMDELRVRNPAGFRSDDFLSLRESGMAVSLATLREPVVELPRLAFTGIGLNLEKSGGKTNFGTILDNLKKLERGDSAPAEPQGEGKRFIVRELAIRDVTIGADLLPIGGDATKATVRIDEILLKDIGSENARGVVMSELASIVVRALLDAAAKHGGGILPAELLGDLQGGLAGLKSLQDLGVSLSVDGVGSLGDLKGAAENVGQTVKDAGEKAKEIGKELEEVGKGLGDMFRKKE